MLLLGLLIGAVGLRVGGDGIWQRYATLANPEGEPSLAFRLDMAQRTLTVLLVLAFVYLGREAWLESQRWHTAVPVTGNLVRIDKATEKPWIDKYVVKYRDPAGGTQEAVIEGRELYVAPREPGEPTGLSYVEGNPPQVRGPAHARDAAFLKYTPQFIGVVAIYMVASFIAGRFPMKPPAKIGLTTFGTTPAGAPSSGK